MTDRTNKTAPAFTLSDADGATHTLEDYNDHWLLLVFHRHLG
jgi:peroxiredoxin